MPKACEKCGSEYKGFGTVCAACRAKPKAEGETSAPQASASGPDACEFCKTKVYAMERVNIDGACFHKACFRCQQCNTQLSAGKFGKLGGKYYCKVHAAEVFRRRGRYDDTHVEDGNRSSAVNSVSAGESDHPQNNNESLSKPGLQNAASDSSYVMLKNPMGEVVQRGAGSSGPTTEGEPEEAEKAVPVPTTSEECLDGKELVEKRLSQVA